MDIYTPTSSEASNSPTKIIRTGKVTRTPAKTTTPEQLRGVAGREMTYELPLWSISSCSQFSGDIFRSDSQSTSLSSDVFYVEPVAPRPSPRHSSTKDEGNKQKDEGRDVHFSPLSVISCDNSYQSGELELHGYRSRPVIPPSLNDLDLSPNHINVLTTIPVPEAKEKERKMTRQENLSLVNISPLSLPSSEANLGDVSASTFHTYESPEYFPPKKAKRKLSIGMSFPKSGGV